ncbi:MAG: sulfurtransferase TusA family protein [Burkholderiales bacterium]|nr:sulfurtransferase TusA family protein [Burkholderiales bacterium]
MSETMTLDLTGMKCPVPIVRLNTEVRQVDIGMQLEALSDDPAFELDVKAWCRRTGHELLSMDSSGSVIKACIRRRV